MILVDTNLLIYAGAADLPQHDASREWLTDTLAGGPRVGIAWASLLGFVRILTHPRVVARPLSLRDAWRVVEGWLELPRVWVPGPGEEHARLLGGYLQDISRGDDVMDAHIAALATEHGLTLCTADRGFARFRGLRWQNPLER